MATPNLVNFSATPLAPNSVDADRYVWRDAPVLFKAGSYPDKQFSMSPAEVVAAAADFKEPVDMDIEHKPSVFDGKLGKLAKVATFDNGNTLSGKVAVPKWLDKIIPPGTPVSVSFDRTTKRIKGCAFTLKPRIEDAALFAAFSADEAAAGRIPPPPVIPPENDKMGQGANAGGTPQHGAALFRQACEMLKQARSTVDEAVFSKSYVADLDRLIEMCEKLEQKSGGKGKESDGDDQGGKNKANMSGLTDEQTAEFNRLKAENAALKVQRTNERAATIASEAAAFADGEVIAKRQFPAAKPALILAYTQAAMADDATFSATNQPGQAVATLRATYAACPAHNLDVEALNQTDQSRTALDPNFSDTRQTPPPGGGKPVISPERRQFLLNQTRLGQQVLAGDPKKNGTH